MSSGFGRTEIVIGIAGIALATVGIFWIVGDALLDALQRESGFPYVEWIAFGAALLGGLPVNEFARGRLQERGMDHAATGLAIMLAVGVAVALYGIVLLVAHTLFA